MMKKQSTLDEFGTSTKWWMLYWEMGLGWKRASRERLELTTPKPGAWNLGFKVSWLQGLLGKVYVNQKGVRLCSCRGLGKYLG